jgi:hypothetical protein
MARVVPGIHSMDSKPPLKSAPSIGIPGTLSTPQYMPLRQQISYVLLVLLANGVIQAGRGVPFTDYLA